MYLTTPPLNHFVVPRGGLGASLTALIKALLLAVGARALSRECGLKAFVGDESRLMNKETDVCVR